MTKEQELARLKSIMSSMKLNFEILESAVGNNHVPNTYATSNALLYALKEFDKIAAKRYRQWNDGEDF